MKKYTFGLLLLLLCSMELHAQNVYTQIRQKALAVVSDASSNATVRQYCQFKVDALDYMAMKMKEKMPDSTATFLDKQALALNQFTSLYMQALFDHRTDPANYQVKLIKLFIDASISNPLFHDNDRELTLSYFANADSPTRFSLDTDWQRAYIVVYSELKKLK